MSEKLICAECRESNMKWIDPDISDLLENGIMKCEKCGAEFKGINEWYKTYMRIEDGNRNKDKT